MILTVPHPSYGPPPPVTELTVEQDLKLRVLYDAIEKPETKREDINTIIIALQHQNFVLSNSMINLVKKWPSPTRSNQKTNSHSQTTKDQAITKEEKPRFGTLFGITI